ncbi:carboxymuconolactone decarboxylase family protein [Lentzea sp. NPDC051213]|uniref:carboxymuconolactone decarboxylase family protein n=1 Tax=Lentzea sp. NPDC051213 TaxID=3364126 RepID=UPI0037BAE123
MPRVHPVPRDQQVGEVAELLGVFTGGGAVLRHQGDHPPLNALATVVRNPALFRVLVPQVRYLANGALPERDRELALLRIAARVPCPYEWAQHRPAAQQAGVTDSEIARVAEGLLDDHWDDHDHALLTAVDEMLTKADVADETWARLARRYAEAQLIEFVVLVGEYQKLAILLNVLRTPIDSWLGGDAVPPS